jgi:hypothetical protein
VVGFLELEGLLEFEELLVFGADEDVQAVDLLSAFGEQRALVAAAGVFFFLAEELLLLFGL